MLFFHTSAQNDSVIACPENFIAKSGRCYGFETQSMKRSDGNRKCKERGDSYALVIINDSQENDFLVEQIHYRVSLTAKNFG